MWVGGGVWGCLGISECGLKRFSIFFVLKTMGAATFLRCVQCLHELLEGIEIMYGDSDTMYNYRKNMLAVYGCERCLIFIIIKVILDVCLYVTLERHICRAVNQTSTSHIYPHTESTHVWKLEPPTKSVHVF